SFSGRASDPNISRLRRPMPPLLDHCGGTTMGICCALYTCTSCLRVALNLTTNLENCWRHENVGFDVAWKGCQQQFVSLVSLSSRRRHLEGTVKIRKAVVVSWERVTRL